MLQHAVHAVRVSLSGIVATVMEAAPPKAFSACFYRGFWLYCAAPDGYMFALPECVPATLEESPMPIYEYRCESCGGHHEALQKLADAPLLRCPHCGNDGLRRQVSAAGFRLKGGGWYETDFKNGQRKNIAGDAAATGSKPESGGQASAPGGAAAGATTAE